MRLCTFILAAQYDRTLYFRPMVCSFFLSFPLAYSQRSQIGCLPYFHTWCSLCADLECMSEMCCTRLAKLQYAKIGQKSSWRVWGTQQISTGFASWLRYYSDVAQRKSTKLCTTFGRLLGISPHSSIKLCRCSDRLEKF